MNKTSSSLSVIFISLINMNKRFVWNFEIKPGAFNFPDHDQKESEGHWEARFFWLEENIIVLNNLNEPFLNLSNFELKKRNDDYCLFENFDANLKLRRDVWVYKPLLEERNGARRYGPKIHIQELNPGQKVPGFEIEANILLSTLEKKETFNIQKEALIYTFPTKPKVKMELARIRCKEKTFFSVSFESRVIEFVRTLQQKVLEGAHASDYVTFLKELHKHD